MITEFGHVMLSDFGTITNNDNDSTARNSTVCGTILYLAPEAIHCETITDAVDIWAIGCILYLMFTGCFLFEGEDEFDLFVVLTLE